jgi:hypothetical protein
MTTTYESRTLSVIINCPPNKVYEFASDPQNLPRWAAGLCTSIRNFNGEWIAETSQGSMKVRLTEKNAFGVLDQYVTPAPGVEVYVPMRVLSNGTGCEVIFTLFRAPDMSDEKYAEDAKLVERDLRTLKSLMEA